MEKTVAKDTFGTTGNTSPEGIASVVATRRQVIAGVSSALITPSVAGALLAGWGKINPSFADTQIGGELSILGWGGYDDAEASAPFREKNNVTVTANALSTPDEVVTKLLAGGAKNLSLVTPACFQTPQMVEAGVADPVDWGRLPNASEYIPWVADSAKSFAVDGQVYSAPYIWGINGLLYNAKYLPEAPKSWMDLTKPEFANKIALTDSALDNFHGWGRALGYDPHNMTQPELDKVTEFLINLKRNQARTFTMNYDDLARQFASGDIIAVASPLWIAITGMAKKLGGEAASVAWTLPIEGGMSWIDSWALPKGGTNRDTAYAWMDYMISAPAQVIVATKLLSGTVNKSAVGLLSAEARAIYPYDNPELITKRAPSFGFPSGKNGMVNYDAWLQAWKRIVAA